MRSFVGTCSDKSNGNSIGNGVRDGNSVRNGNGDKVTVPVLVSVSVLGKVTSRVLVTVLDGDGVGGCGGIRGCGVGVVLVVFVACGVGLAVFCGVRVAIHCF